MGEGGGRRGRWEKVGEVGEGGGGRGRRVKVGEVGGDGEGGGEGDATYVMGCNLINTFYI